MEKDGQEIFEEYLNYHKLFRFEGNGGIRKLSKIIRDINPDYTTIEEFFEDNPGAIHSVVDWIGEQIDGIDEWKDGLESTLPEKEVDE
jgi:hypothetical protein